MYLHGFMDIGCTVHVELCRDFHGLLLFRVPFKASLGTKCCLTKPAQDEQRAGCSNLEQELRKGQIRIVVKQLE